jgi:rod shape-determining protein MreD
MKLSLFLFVAGLFFVVLQSTFLRLLPLGPIVPDFVLVLCVYWGLYHPTVGGVLGSFILGYAVDTVSSRILGLNAFTMSLVFLAVYMSSRSIWLQNPMISVIVVFLASLVKGAALVLLWAVFLSVDEFWAGALRYVLMEALVAAALAPLIFALLQRGQNYMDRLHLPAQ